MGNPGTGRRPLPVSWEKFSLRQGVLSGKEFRFVEATESDLISSNVGGTAEQTQALLEKARGRILFIDEAYSLDKRIVMSTLESKPSISSNLWRTIVMRS